MLYIDNCLNMEYDVTGGDRMNVTCENHFCVYWREDTCTLRKISLDAVGACRDCVTVEVPKDLLARKRQELLSELREREARWGKEALDL